MWPAQIRQFALHFQVIAGPLCRRLGACYNLTSHLMVRKSLTQVPELR